MSGHTEKTIVHATMGSGLNGIRMAIGELMEVSVDLLTVYSHETGVEYFAAIAYDQNPRDGSDYVLFEGHVECGCITEVFRGSADKAFAECVNLVGARTAYVG